MKTNVIFEDLSELCSTSIDIKKLSISKQHLKLYALYDLRDGYYNCDISDLLYSLDSNILINEFVFDKNDCYRLDSHDFESALYLVPFEPVKTVSSIKKSLVVCISQLKKKYNFLDDVIVNFLFIILDSKRFNGRLNNNSYTLSDTPNTIYLDVFDLNVITKENIVHEITHSLLNFAIDSESNNLEQAPSLFSPWKNSFRPAKNILHTFFAFSVVFDFLLSERDSEKKCTDTYVYIDSMLPRIYEGLDLLERDIHTLYSYLGTTVLNITKKLQEITRENMSFYEGALKLNL